MVVSAIIQSPPQSDLVATYNAALTDVLDKHAPLVCRVVRDKRSAPWMSPIVKEAKKHRRRAERQWRKSGLTVHRQIYNHFRNIVNHLICDAKRQYICKRILVANSSKELFRLTGELLGKPTIPVRPSTIPIATLPDAFNTFFIDKIINLRQELQSLSHPVDGTHFHGNSFDTFHPVTIADVKAVILHMPKKSCELDPVPISLFLECLDDLLPLICHIINISLASGTVPLSFKHAIVKPLLKKSSLDPECLKNYRPVSNLSFLSKVLEHVVLSQCLAHLHHYNLFEPFQSAYRKGYSTETALLRIVNDLLQASDSGCVSILSLLDLSAAFDTIDHGILLSRLATSFGFSGTVLSWFHSYLSNRTQRVMLEGMQSRALDLVCGVPQGSVLGPILFSLYIQPLSLVLQPTGISYHFFFLLMTLSFTHHLNLALLRT